MASQRTLKVLLTGKMGSGKGVAAEYLHDAYGATRWSRTELMKRLAHATAHAIGSPDEWLERLFPDAADEEVREQVREELLAYQAPEERGKPRMLYQGVTELVQAHDPLCFERELAARIASVPGVAFSLVDDVRVKAAFDFFAEQGYITVRIDAPEELRRARMLARDGYLPAEETFQHPSETELDDVAHDYTVGNDTENPADLYARLDALMATLTGRQAA